MACSEFYCQPSASNLNAGSTTADAATLTFTSGSWVASTGIFSCPGASLSAVNVGDFASVYNDGATVGVFVGRVTAKDDTLDTITVSLTAKSGTAPTDGTGNRTIKVGGAWKGPNAEEAFPIGFIDPAQVNAAGDTTRINFKSGTNYAITAAMTNTFNGPVRFQGYTTTPGDGGRAVIDGGTTGASYILLTMVGLNFGWEDIIFQNNGATGSAVGVSFGASRTIARRCVFSNMRGSGVQTGAYVTLVECEAYGCNQSNTADHGGFRLAATHATCIRCIAHDNAGSNSSGFVNATAASLLYCIADTNGFCGIYSTAVNVNTYLGCDLYNNVSDGIRLANAAGAGFVIESCNLIDNGGWGINGTGAGVRVGMVVNCGFGSGTAANASGTTTGLKSMLETGSFNYAADVTPYQDPANGDFRISLSAAKGAGRGSFLQTASGYAGTAAYPDVGAAQHLEAAGGFIIGG